MDFSLENTDAPPKKSPGVLVKVLAAVSGLAAGGWASIIVINNGISKNLRQLAEPGFARLKQMRAGSKAENTDWSPLEDELVGADTVEARFDLAQKIQKDMRLRFESAMNARAPDEMRRMLTSDSLIGKAYKKAKASDPVINFSSQKTRQAIAEQAAHRSSLPGEDEMTAKGFKDLLFNLEEKNMEAAILSTPNHIPLKDRLLFSRELHLSGGQKAGAALAFVGVAAVAAGAVYYGIKHFKTNKEKLAQSQEAAML